MLSVEHLVKIASLLYMNHIRSCHYTDRYCIPPVKDDFFSRAQRSAIVDYILRRKSYSDDADKKYSLGNGFVVTFEIYSSLKNVYCICDSW